MSNGLTIAKGLNTVISELSWSLIDPRPVVARYEEYDVDLCFWNGVVTTKKYGLMILLRLWSGLSPSPAMQDSAWEELRRCCGFNLHAGQLDPIHIEYETNYSYYNRVINRISKDDHKFFPVLRSKYTTQEALSWFMNARAITISADNDFD